MEATTEIKSMNDIYDKIILNIAQFLRSTRKFTPISGQYS